jgi:hypothetical protein
MIEFLLVYFETRLVELVDNAIDSVVGKQDASAHLEVEEGILLLRHMGLSVLVIHEFVEIDVTLCNNLEVLQLFLKHEETLMLNRMKFLPEFSLLFGMAVVSLLYSVEVEVAGLFSDQDFVLEKVSASKV